MDELVLERLRVAAGARTLVDDATLEARRAGWTCPEPRYTSGVLAKYAVLAQGADKGAITLP